MRITLQIAEPGPLGPRARYEGKGKAFTLGRGARADWTLPDNSRSLSTIHCRFDPTAKGYAVTDLSRNGTTLNGNPLTPQVATSLAEGDVLLTGPYEIEVGSGPSEIAVPAPQGVPFGADFIGAFARGAGIDADALSARGEIELAEEAGAIVAVAYQFSRAMDSARGDAARTIAAENADLDDIALDASLSHRDATREQVDARLEAFLDHDEAMFAAMQTALFKLLNELAPETNEAGSARKSWARYRSNWSGLMATGDHGALDAFMAYFRDAYEERLRES